METTVTSEVKPVEQPKSFLKNKGKLLLLLLLLLVLCIIGVIAFIATRPSPSSSNDNSTVSAPVTNNTSALPNTDLTLTCESLNEDVKVSVPSDWNCGKNDGSLIKDLIVSNGSISIRFPVDIQPSLGCGLDTTTCSGESIYSSTKVQSLDLIRIPLTTVNVLTSIIKTDNLTFPVDVAFSDTNKTSLTDQEKSLIIKILESITSKTTPSSNLVQE